MSEPGPSARTDSAKMLAAWSIQVGVTGNQYYYNSITGAISYTPPPGWTGPTALTNQQQQSPPLPRMNEPPPHVPPSINWITYAPPFRKQHQQTQVDWKGLWRPKNNMNNNNYRQYSKREDAKAPHHFPQQPPHRYNSTPPTHHQHYQTPLSSTSSTSVTSSSSSTSSTGTPAPRTPPFVPSTPRPYHPYQAHMHAEVASWNRSDVLTSSSSSSSSLSSSQHHNSHSPPLPLSLIPLPPTPPTTVSMTMGVLVESEVTCVSEEESTVDRSAGELLEDDPLAELMVKHGHSPYAYRHLLIPLSSAIDHLVDHSVDTEETEMINNRHGDIIDWMAVIREDAAQFKERRAKRMLSFDNALSRLKMDGSMHRVRCLREIQHFIEEHREAALKKNNLDENVL